MVHVKMYVCGMGRILQSQRTTSMKYGNVTLHDYQSYTHVEARYEDDERVEVKLGCVVVAVGTGPDLRGSFLQPHARASHSGCLYHGKKNQN